MNRAASVLAWTAMRQHEDHNFTAVRGKFEENSFVKQLHADIEQMGKRCEADFENGWRLLHKLPADRVFFERQLKCLKTQIT